MSRRPATIDGRPVEILVGETILQAARRIGVQIPTLCSHPNLPAEGGCRVCLVDIGGPRPVGACHTPLREGMVVLTATPTLHRLRREVLALTLTALPANRLEVSLQNTEFEKLLRQCGLDLTTNRQTEAARPLDASHPYLRFDPGLCITCRRCLHACEMVQGQFVYGIAGRGSAARLILGADADVANSGCVACGACVEHCPTGAITDRDRLGNGHAGATTDSICGYCGVGCRIRVAAETGQVNRIDGVADAAVNRGHLCVKGRYAHGWHHHAERLVTPLLREGDAFRAVSWGTATAWLATRLAAIRDEHGPDALGFFSSSRTTNEAAYLVQKLARAVIGTNNVDCCARVCHSSTALALQTVTGTGAASASYTDIDHASTIVVAGANPTEAHPVVGARIKQAVLAGARLVVIDPRRIELAEYADVHLPLRPGTNVPVFNALAKIIIETGLAADSYLAERVEGLEELTEFLARTTLTASAEASGLSVAALREAGELLGRAGPALFVHGLGLSELIQGTASVMALCNLGMLTGSIGTRGAGMLPLRGQNNVQGNADMGGMPNQVTGYQSVTDPQVRERVEEIWERPLPANAGLTIPEMLKAAGHGTIRSLWIQGEDVVQSDPQSDHVVDCLSQLELLVVQELFMTDTARLAHLILPAAGSLEQGGTFTNGERRIQLVRPAVPPPGEAKPDWEAVQEVANALGAEWCYDTPAKVMDEIAQVAPRLFGGVSYERLEGDGLQWPCPKPDHPGTATVHADGFLRGRGQLVCIEPEPNPEDRVEGFPCLLITGRVLDHYNVGTMTRRTPSNQIVAADYLELHPDDAAALGLADGQTTRVESRWGSTVVPVTITPRIASGTAFLAFHFPASGTNLVVGPHLDPDSQCPQYKVTAVRLSAADR